MIRSTQDQGMLTVSPVHNPTTNSAAIRKDCRLFLHGGPGGGTIPDTAGSSTRRAYRRSY